MAGQRKSKAKKPNRKPSVNTKISKQSINQELTPKQIRFIQEYLVDLDGKSAAIRAGYSARSAHVQASRLLSHDKIQSELAKGKQEIAERYDISKGAIINEFAKIGYANMQDYMTIGHNGMPMLDWSNLTRDQASALSEVTVDSIRQGKDMPDIDRVKFKLSDKQSALVHIAKMMGHYKEEGININIQPVQNMWVIKGVKPVIEGETD